MASEAVLAAAIFQSGSSGVETSTNGPLMTPLVTVLTRCAKITLNSGIDEYKGHPYR